MIVRSIHDRCRAMAQIPADFMQSSCISSDGIKTLCATCAKFLRFIVIVQSVSLQKRAQNSVSSLTL